MDINKIFGKNTGLITAAIVMLVMILPIIYSIVSHVSAEGNSDLQPFLEMPDPKYKNCVRETDYMRYHHWELLRGIREEVVRYGKREDINFNKCRECHTSREQFCNKCHNAVSMTPDCFSCHYYP